MKAFFAILILALFMMSCEYSYDYSYTVTNMTGSQIKVFVKTFQIDSTFTISMDSTKTLIICNHGIEGSKGPYFDNVTVDLEKYTVTKNDSLTSSRDYLKNESWTFNDGDYSTIVTDDEYSN